MRMRRGSGNVFRDLGFPEGEAYALALRSELMISIEDVVKQSRLTRPAVAKRLGIARPRFNALLRGRIGQFDLDALVTIAVRAGLRVDLEIVRPRTVRSPLVSRRRAPKAPRSEVSVR